MTFQPPARGADDGDRHEPVGRGEHAVERLPEEDCVTAPVREWRVSDERQVGPGEAEERAFRSSQVRAASTAVGACDAGCQIPVEVVHGRRRAEPVPGDRGAQLLRSRCLRSGRRDLCCARVEIGEPVVQTLDLECSAGRRNSREQNDYQRRETPWLAGRASCLRFPSFPPFRASDVWSERRRDASTSVEPGETRLGRRSRGERAAGT